ncbi:MAG TPA: hypothetical protein VFQ53_16470 [Kofleriaceae bacterium]|nr:hypothetical protein [Kofleriaceae bacterium]
MQWLGFAGYVVVLALFLGGGPWLVKRLRKPRYELYGVEIKRPRASQTLVGTVVGGPLALAGRHAAGCLGGPPIFDVPELAVALADGRRITIAAKQRVMIDGMERLPRPAPPPPLAHVPVPPIPPSSGDTGFSVLLDGRIEIGGLVADGADRYRVPEGYPMVIKPVG